MEFNDCSCRYYSNDQVIALLKLALIFNIPLYKEMGISDIHALIKHKYLAEYGTLQE